ncbi:MAG: GTPase Era [Deltaproteobacteria bacterium]|nr:GTPase Era [Deltaproteobacteria bacterium]
MSFRSGYIALLGVPNVGKSTLLNQMLGEKLSIVSPKAQTTRHKILGILHRPQAQLLFLDTPGLHLSKKLINKKMLEAALSTLHDADIILHLIMPQGEFKPLDQRLFEEAKKLAKPHWVLINQVDQVAKEKLLPRMEQVQKLWSPDYILPLSAKTGEGVEDLLKLLVKSLPEGPAYFSSEDLTDRNLRFLMAERIREQLFRQLHQELPYGSTVEIEAFEEKEKLISIQAKIILTRESHKGMVLGKKGAKLKSIGQKAREEMEAFLGKKVYLQIFVKVMTGWEKNEAQLKNFGIVE